MSHAVVNRNRVKIERLFKARFFISMSRWIDMVEFLGPLYKMKKKKTHRFDDTEHSPHSCPPLPTCLGVGNSEQLCLCFCSPGLISVTWEWEAMRGVETCTVLYPSYIHYFGPKRCWLSFTKWWLEGLPQTPFRCDCLSQAIVCLLVSAMVQLTDDLIFKCGW